MGACIGVRKTPEYSASGAPLPLETDPKATSHRDDHGAGSGIEADGATVQSPTSYLDVTILEIGGIPRRNKTLDKLSARNGYFCECWYENGSSKKLIYRTITREPDEKVKSSSVIYTPESKIDKFGDNILKIPRQESSGDAQTIPQLRVQVFASYWETSFSDGMSRLVGETTIPVKELERKNLWQLWMFDPTTECLVYDRSHNASPLFVSIRVPSGKPQPTPVRHRKKCVIITRGTRGDVQPFLALARGLAEERDWDLTIITEMRYRDFVLKNSNVKRGGIHFRPSGGDTEARIDRPIAKWFIMQENQAFQMLMLARAEREFFESEPAFSYFVSTEQPDFLLFGFNMANIAIILSEAYRLPICGFLLQPTIIPSTHYPAIVPLGSADPSEKTLTASLVADMQRKRRLSLSGVVKRRTTSDAQEVSSLPSKADSEDYPPRAGSSSPRPDVTSMLAPGMDSTHTFISMLKPLMENNIFTARINAMRQAHKLPKQKGEDLDFKILQNLNVPMICPINEYCFGGRPNDWKPCIKFSDFIYLSPASASEEDDTLSRLSPKLQEFIKDAREANAPIVAIGFSSMPVSRTAILGLSSLVAERSTEGARVISLVGVRPSNEVTDPVEEARANSLKQNKKLLEIAGAPYGLLFPHCDFLVVHGGLGTTSEALRAGKPCLVTGVLLFDQRFWGRRVYELGCGPKPVHVNNLRKEIVALVDKGVKPGSSWAVKAREIAQMLRESGRGDGIALNIEMVAQECEKAAKAFASLSKLQSSRKLLLSEDAADLIDEDDMDEDTNTPPLSTVREDTAGDGVVPIVIDGETTLKESVELDVEKTVPEPADVVSVVVPLNATPKQEDIPTSEGPAATAATLS